MSQFTPTPLQTHTALPVTAAPAASVAPSAVPAVAAHAAAPAAFSSPPPSAAAPLTSVAFSPPPSAAAVASVPMSVVSAPLALTPANGVPVWPTRQVSECAFDFLHCEMVSYFHKQALHSLRGEEPRVIAKKLHAKIESMGFGVGQRYAERYSKDHPLQEQPLDIVKFMCKEFWTLLYKKQIDKLQTNYKGIYVLHDFNFRWIARIYALSPDVDQATLIDQARVYTALACGIIRGALWNLGLNASVKADLQKLPAVSFTLLTVEASTAAAAAKTTAAAAIAAAVPSATSVGAPLQPSIPRPTSGSASGAPLLAAHGSRLRTSTSGAPLTQPSTPTTTRPTSGSTPGRP